ncbi:MOSC domain-containing protein [Aestuariibius insulae]|uniref:MOSC domain-containing protein n=1 Tax=Aestuariibius insulae TaxID=2058287 RepID=UPI00345E84E7
MSDLREMMARFAQPGRLDWIGVRPERRAPMRVLEQAGVTRAGIEGDHGVSELRAVTLVQGEHLPVIAAMLGHKRLPPELLRRNLSVTGLNLAALKGRRLRVGEAELRVTGPCHPCSRMEEVLGTGGYSAVRGHGGWYAEVLADGRITLGDEVVPLEDKPA